MKTMQIVGLITLALLPLIGYFGGYGVGRGQIKIVHDTTQVIDTIVQTDSFYLPAKTDTIVINNISYNAKTSTYRMRRNGFAMVWYIPKRESFKWQVREPDPIVITNTKYEQIKIPQTDWRTTIMVGTVGIIAGFIGGIIIR